MGVATVSTRYDKTNPPLISAGALLGSLEAAAELGVDLGDTLLAHRITRRQVQTGEGVLPLHCVVDFLNDGAARFGCEHFGFLIGRHQPPARFALVGKLIRFCATLGDAIDDAIRLQPPNSANAAWTLEREGDIAMLVRRTRVAYDAPMMQMQTLAVVVVYKAMTAVCDRQVPLRQVLFSHRAPNDVRRLESYFGAPVSFNEANTALVFRAEELQSPLPGHDPVVYRMLLMHLQSLADPIGVDDDLLSRLRRDVNEHLGTPNCNLEATCRRIGVHPRSLQRALRKHGTSLKKLQGDARQELAEHYLRDSETSVLELSQLLGYRNASAFSRAFKLRTGLSPQHWKAIHRH